MKEGYYKAYTDNYSFTMSVLLAGSTYTIWYGDVENKEGPCIEITYNTNDKQVCKLQGISYYPRCAMKKGLAKSHGTIEMLQSILHLVTSKFPEIQRVVFNDVSSVECDDGTSMIVSYASLVQHGKTWYERHFSARMLHKYDRDSLKIFKDLLSKQPTRGTFTFYDKKVLASNVEYDNWHEYFMKMRENHGCEFFSKHKNEIQKASGMQLMYSEWYIRASDIANYPHTVKRIKLYKGLQAGGMTPVVHRPLSMEDLL